MVKQFSLRLCFGALPKHTHETCIVGCTENNSTLCFCDQVHNIAKPTAIHISFVIRTNENPLCCRAGGELRSAQWKMHSQPVRRMLSYNQLYCTGRFMDTFIYNTCFYTGRLSTAYSTHARPVRDVEMQQATCTRRTATVIKQQLNNMY